MRENVADEGMNIASVIVRAHPDRLGGVRRALLALPGVDIHADPGDGRLVVTVEDTARSRAADVLVEMHRLEGVLSAALVYQYADTQFEPARARE